jgi:hypothetical protein
VLLATPSAVASPVSPELPVSPEVASPPVTRSPPMRPRSTPAGLASALPLSPVGPELPERALGLDVAADQASPVSP